MRGTEGTDLGSVGQLRHDTRARRRVVQSMSLPSLSGSPLAPLGTARGTRSRVAQAGEA